MMWWVEAACSDISDSSCELFFSIDVTKLEDALSDKTKAVMIAHTLGNPFDLSAVKAFCAKDCFSIMMIKGVVRLREYVACSNLINHE